MPYQILLVSAAIIGVLLFFALSVYATVFWLTTRIDEVATKHWSMKALWGYGIVFAALIVLAVLLSAVAVGSHLILLGIQ